MRKTILTKKQKQKIEDTYTYCKSTYQTAKILNLDRNIIYRYLKSAHITMDGYTGPRNKYDLDERFFKNIDSEEKAYWLGMLAADGNVRKQASGSWCCALSLAEEDEKHIYKFQKSIKSNIPIKIIKNHKKGLVLGRLCNLQNTILIRIVRNVFCKDLMKHGIIPNKSLILQFPKLKNKYVRHFLRGFLDGDGCWYIRKRRKTKQISFRITCGSYDFLKSFNNYLINNASLNGNKIFKQTKKVHNITYEGNLQCKRIFDYLYKDATIYLDRKFELATGYFKQLEKDNNNA